MISDFLGGTSQNEVMGVGIANDHALRIAQGVPPMIQSFRLQSYSNCIIIAHSHLIGDEFWSGVAASQSPVARKR